MLRLLSEASRQLSSSLDFEDTLKNVAALAVPALGDWCIVDLVGTDGRLRRAAVAHRDPEKVAVFWKRHAAVEPPTGIEVGPLKVFRSGKPDLRNGVGERFWRELGFTADAAAEVVRMHAFVTVPLLARGRTTGTLTFAWAESRRRYARADLHHLEDLAGRIALALDNARLFQEATDARSALERERSRLAGVIEHLPVAAVLAEAPDGRFVLANRMVEEILRRPLLATEDLSEYRAFSGIRPDGSRLRLEDWPLSRALLQGEVVQNQELELVRDDGTHVFVSASAAPIREADGGISGALLTFSDVTQTIAARRKVEALATALEQAVHARDEFLAIAAHELRTPLTSLRLHVHTLRSSARRGSLAPEVLLHRADSVDKQVLRLTRLVDSLLDVSRMHSGRLELHPEDVDLVEVVRETMTRMSEDAARVGSTLTLDAPERLVGRWDRLRVEQVAANLLSNALKYGAGAPVRLFVAQEADQAVFSVRDGGIGIAAEDQPRLFDRFERAVSEHNYGGFGLGLWIVRQIVEAFSGTVGVVSAKGEGACFTVRMPLVAPGLEANGAEGAA